MYCAGSAMVAPQLVLVVGVLGLFLCNHAAGAAGRDLGLSQTQLHVRIDLSNGDPARAPMVALSTPASTTDGPRVTWELPPSIEVQRWFAVNVTDADSNVVYSTGMSSVLALLYLTLLAQHGWPGTTCMTADAHTQLPTHMPYA